MARAKLGLAVVTFAAFSTLVAAPAQAQVEDEAATAMARERFKEGVSYFDRGQYERARAAFLQAYALKKHPSVLLNLAHSEQRSGHEADAAKHFVLYLRDHREASVADRQMAEEGLVAARAAVGEVTVIVDLEQAEVQIDGTTEGVSPLPGPIFVMPGTHLVLAKKAGISRSEKIVTTAGQPTRVNITFKEGRNAATTGLEKLPEATPPPPPPDPFESPPPSAEERMPFFEWLGQRHLAKIGAGFTLVGVASGLGFLVGAETKYSDSDRLGQQIEEQAILDSNGRTATNDLCVDPTAWLRRANFPAESIGLRARQYGEACQSQQDSLHTAESLRTVSIISWVVGGLAAGSTVAYYYMDPKAYKKGEAETGFSATVMPSLSPSHLGLSITGRF